MRPRHLGPEAWHMCCALCAGGQAWAVNERQAEALQRAAEALRCAAASAADGLPLDFWALDLRGALLALGEARPWHVL